MKPYYENNYTTILNGDCLEVLRQLPDESVHCCVTSPPYFGLRDYGADGQIGLEPSPSEYVAKLVEVFREVRRVLRSDGTCWINLGDSYAGSGPSGASYQSATTRERAGKTTDGVFRVSKTLGERGLTYAEKKPIPPPGLKPKDLVGIPWRVAFALQEDGWWLRQDIIWAKPNPMPESVTDRCTKSHEYIFLLAKSERYYFDQDAIKEPAKYPGDHGFLRGPIEGCDSNTIAWRAKSQQARKLAGIDSTVAGDDYRNRRSVWTVSTKPYSGAHFACFPPDLIEPCILAGCPEGGTVLDPFGGSGTTGQVATELGRKSILIELNPKYCDLAIKRNRDVIPRMALFEQPAAMIAGNGNAQEVLNFEQ